NTILPVAGNGVTTYQGDSVAAVSTGINYPQAVAVDTMGNVYIADYLNARVRKVDTSGIITTIAGNGVRSYSGDGGPATAAGLDAYGVAVDRKGNIYICDRGDNRIRKINTSGIITTVAGTGGVFYSGNGGPATAATIWDPQGVAVDSIGNIYIADYGNNRVRKVDTFGIINTIAGGGFTSPGDGGAATAASLARPTDVAVDIYGNVYTTEYFKVRKISPSGIITTAAGNGGSGFSGDGGPATAANVAYPYGLATDATGNLYMIDNGNRRIRKVNTAGIITTVAGSGALGGTGDGGAATLAKFNALTGIACDRLGNVYVTDEGTNTVRKVLTGNTSVAAITGTTSVTVGSTTPLADATPGGTWSSSATGVATVSSTGVVTGVSAGTAIITYVLSTCSVAYDTALVTVSAGVLPCNGINTIAGWFSAGYAGDSGAATAASLNRPYGIVQDAAGNIYFSEEGNNIIRKVDASGTISTFAGTGSYGFSGDGGPASAATFNYPYGLARDAAGNLYIADNVNNKIRKITAGGIISTFAGTGTSGSSGDGGAATAATLNRPKGVATDASGNVYILDQSNKVRKVNTSGIISTFAGNGTAGFAGDGGAATAARLNGPAGIAFDAAGNAYIADLSNNRIRKVTPAGNISTIAGNSGAGFGGDGGPATAAQLNGPTAVATDRSDNLYIADAGNYRIRVIDRFGNISTQAGTGTSGFSGDGGVASSAQMTTPYGLTTDTLGTIYFTDYTNHRVRKIVPGLPLVPQITGAGSMVAGSSLALANTTTGGSWSTSNAAVATVSATGTVTGVTAGTAIITYAVTSGCGSVYDTALVTVTLGCIPTISNAATSCLRGEYVRSFSLTGALGTYIYDSSACSSPYADQTVLSASLYDGRSYPARATTASTFVTGVQGWIDFNDNHIFESSERIGGTTAFIGSTAGTIYIPAGVAPGIHILRVMVVDTSAGGSSYPNINPCGGYAYGEARDYKVTILSTPACSGTPVAGTATATDTAGCTAYATTLSVTGFTFGTGIGFQWQSSPDNSTWTDVSGATDSTYTGTVTTDIYYRVKVTCATSGISSYANTLHMGYGIPATPVITGGTLICAPAGTVFSGTPAGGVWTTTGHYSTINTTSGLAIAFGVGRDTISYTTTNACGSSTATHVADAYSAPNAGTISGPATLCVGGGATYTDTTTGGTWAVTNTALATVTTAGAVTARAAGTVRVLYIKNNPCSADTAAYTITINNSSTAGTITGPTTVCVGATITLADTATGGTWSSGSPSLATVSSTGVVTGLGGGTVVISYGVSGGACGTTYATQTINVIPSGAGTITGTAFACPGGTSALSDSVFGGAWSSSNTTVATISSTGLVTALTTGVTTISYTVSGSCGTGVATRVFAVNPLPNAGSLSGSTIICPGTTTTITPTVSGGSWSSGSPAVASVNSTGLVRGNAAGTAVITYAVTNSCGTATTTITINVNSSATAGTITGSGSVCIGATTTLSDSVAGGTWATSAATVASISTTGVVTGVATGSATLTYTVVNSCGTASTTRSISVSPLPVAGTISGAATACIGVPTTFTTTGSGGTWSSTNTTVATISATGAVSPLTAGTTRILYTSTNSCGTDTAGAAFTVIAAPVVSAITGPTNLCLSATATYSATPTGGTWASSDTAIASVGSTGIAYGVGTGAATISYTFTNACGTADTTLSVLVGTTPSAGSISGTSPLCQGASAVFTNSTAGGTWSSNNTTIA
ncbi:MAG: hypothetical protein EBZ77_03125, partial [Chitinophagia bacterium]|nr:hypothetical protein [Chitinophagia bacterium]